MKEYIYPLRIYYEDTDFNGFVYFSKYLNFMERAATNLIASLGIRASDLIKEDILISVRSLKCEYLKPAKLDDDIEVVTTIPSYTEVVITWDHLIRSQQNKNLIYCHAIIDRVCVNSKLFPVKITPEFLQLLKKNS